MSGLRLRLPSLARDGAPSSSIVAVRFACSWMGPRPWDGRYAAAGRHLRRWFLDAPPCDSPLGGERRFDPLRALEDVLHIESERLAVDLHGAPSYLVASGARPERVRFRWSGPFPWEREAGDIAWERSNCWASGDPADPEAWLPLAPRQFTLLTMLRAAAAGRLRRELFVRRAGDLFEVEPELAGDWFGEPHRTIRDLLEPRRPAERRG